MDEFQVFIDRAKVEMPEELSSISEPDCFVRLWLSSDGICPETECVFRTYCQAGYEAAYADSHKYPEYIENPVAKKVVEVVGPPVSKKRKYEENGYVFQGRTVDILIRTLVEHLDEPLMLPAHWTAKQFSEKYNELGRLVLSQTASYHAFLMDGQIVCRFWTTAAKFALVDLSTLLVTKARSCGKKVLPISEKSKYKLRPCTGRIYCETITDVAQLASWIKEVYKLEDDNGQE